MEKDMEKSEVKSHLSLITFQDYQRSTYLILTRQPVRSWWSKHGPRRLIRAAERWRARLKNCLQVPKLAWLATFHNS